MRTIASEAQRRAPTPGVAPPSVTTADLERARAGVIPTDPRRVTVGRLYTIDLPRAVRAFCSKGFTKDERETLRTDALLLLVKWSEHGGEGKYAPMPLGGSELLPLRRDWLAWQEAKNGGAWEPTEGAWRAMRAALRQAAERRGELLREMPGVEVVPMAGETISETAARIQDEARSNPETADGWEYLGERSSQLPDADTERLAALMDIPLKAARALIYDGFDRTPDEASAEWGIARSKVASRASEGRAELRKRFPDSRELLSAIRDASGAYRAVCEDTARITAQDLADGYATAQELHTALANYSAAQETAPLMERATLAALRRAAATAGVPLDGAAIARAPRIAASIGRLMAAEMTRARRTAHRTAPVRNAAPNGAGWASVPHAATTRGETAPSRKRTNALARRDFAALAARDASYCDASAALMAERAASLAQWEGPPRDSFTTSPAPGGALQGCGCPVCIKWRRDHAR